MLRYFHMGGHLLSSVLDHQSWMDGCAPPLLLAACTRSLYNMRGRKTRKSPLQCMVDLPEMNATTKPQPVVLVPLYCFLVYTHTSSCLCASFCSAS